MECAFFSEAETCRAIDEGEEGKALRKQSCRNEVKDHCCYSCADQDVCDISCNYLRKSDLSDPSKAVDRELKRYSAAIERLSVFYAEGRISEQSYLISVRKLEERINRLKEAKESPDTDQASVESIRQFREPSIVEESPTGLWFLVPFIFGLIGGLVAYIGVKDRDDAMATSLLVFGIVWSIIASLIAWVWWSSLLSSLYRYVSVLSTATC